MSKKGDFLTKKVVFAGKEMTLFSLDGVTWSTRPDELQTIIERHSNEQQGFSADLQGKEKEKAKDKPKPKRFKRVHDDDELDEVIEDDLHGADVDDELDDVDDPDADIEIDKDLLKEVLARKGKKGAEQPVEAPPLPRVGKAATSASSVAKKAPVEKIAKAKAPGKEAAKPEKKKAKPSASKKSPKKAPPKKAPKKKK